MDVIPIRSPLRWTSYRLCLHCAAQFTRSGKLFIACQFVAISTVPDSFVVPSDFIHTDCLFCFFFQIIENILKGISTSACRYDGPIISSRRNVWRISSWINFLGLWFSKSRSILRDVFHIFCGLVMLYYYTCAKKLLRSSKFLKYQNKNTAFGKETSVFQLRTTMQLLLPKEWG